MDKTQTHRHLPDMSRLSVLAATIFLAYAMSSFLTIPEREFSFQMPGLFLSFEFDIQTLIGLLVGGITAAGANWLYRSHPSLGSQYVFQHWIVPALTALVIGILLFQLPYGPVWIFGLFLGGGILVLVLLAEYIAIDMQDVRQPPAAIALISVSYALFLILAVSLRSSGARLFMVLPAIISATWFVSLRVIHLRLSGEWMLIESGIIAIFLGQIASAFHYWPFTPISYGLIIVGITYSLNSLMMGFAEGKGFRQIIREPILALMFSLILAFLMG